MIIKEGKIKERKIKTYIVKCKYCKSLFTCNDNTEIFLGEWYNDFRNYIECEYCKERTPLPVFLKRYKGKGE